jgi:hypothetical protein
VAGGVAAAIVVLLCLRVVPMTREQPGFAEAGDHHKYVYMAEEGPWAFHVAPFCWRIGVPLVARVLPFGIQTNFMLITFASLWGAGVGMYWLGQVFGKSWAAGMFGMLAFFGVGWATKYAVFDFWLPDPAAVAIVTLAACCVLTRRAAAFATLLALGVLVKESVIFVAPLWWTLPQTGDGPYGQRLVRGVFAVLPAAVILVGLRMAIPAKNHDAEYVRSLSPRLTEVDEGRTSYAYSEQLQRISWQRVKDVSVRFLETVHSYSVGSLGVLPLALPFFAMRRNARLLLRLLPFLVLVYAQLLLATDTQRLLVLALPAVLLMTLNGWEALVQRCGTGAAVWLPLPALLIGLNLWKADRIAGPSWVEACVLAAYAGAVWAAGRWRQRDADGR